uniref:Uncharacterized protein n=1 Tax=Physcomitrium patens TaxID=3218 RepID=A0A7I3Z6U4_PHYPA
MMQLVVVSPPRRFAGSRAAADAIARVPEMVSCRVDCHAVVHPACVDLRRRSTLSCGFWCDLAMHHTVQMISALVVKYLQCKSSA